jgi:hypothetical protein
MGEVMTKKNIEEQYNDMISPPHYENKDDIKKTLTVSDFISLSAIYEIINFNLNIIASGLQGEYADDIRSDLQAIYDLVISAVVLKDGSIPEHWDIPISDCDISMSANTMQELYNKINAFKDEMNECYSDLDEEERMIAQNFNETALEIHLDCLLGLIVDL